MADQPYNPTWTRNPLGSYNEQEAFIAMNGGTGAYIMEDEWNEMQWILGAQRAKALSKLFASGFLTKGTDSVANGTITLAPRDAFVNGHQIRMEGKSANSGNVLVTLPAGPASGTRSDLVYLTVSFVAVNYQSTIYKWGYQGGDALTNDLYDNRVGNETQRRVQKQWNIAVAQGQSTMAGAGFTATTYDSRLYTATNNAAVDGLTYAIPLYIANRTAGSPDTLTDYANYLFSFANAGQAGGFATLGSTGTLPPGQLPAATATQIGGVKPGTGLTVAGDGTLNATQYTLPSDVAKTDVAQTWTQPQTFSVAPSFTASSGAPFSVSSSANVPNLNASTLNGYVINQNLRTTDSPTFVGGTFSGAINNSNPSPFIATSSGNTARFISNWASGNYAGIGPNSSTNDSTLRIGLTNGAGAWQTPTGTNFKAYVAGALSSFKNVQDDGTGASTTNGLATFNGGIALPPPSGNNQSSNSFTFTSTSATGTTNTVTVTLDPSGYLLWKNGGSSKFLIGANGTVQTAYNSLDNGTNGDAAFNHDVTVGNKLTAQSLVVGGVPVTGGGGVTNMPSAWIG